MFLPDGSSQAQSPFNVEGAPSSPQASQGDIALMQRVLAAASQNPNLIPADFMSYVLDWIQTQRLEIPIGQVPGYQQFVNNAIANATFLTVEATSLGAEAHTTSSSYADPTVSGGAGPAISGLPDGQFLILFGGSGGGDFAANVTYHMAVSVNGVTPVDSQSAEFASDRGNTSGAMAVTATLANVAAGGTNTVKCVYRSSDGTDRGDIRYRWVVAVKYGS